MHNYKKIILILIFLSCLTFIQAQELSSEPEAVSGQEFASLPENGVSLDFQIGAGSTFIIPGLSAELGMPITFLDRTLTVTPFGGFLYQFNIMDELQQGIYFPAGVSIIHNPTSLGLKLKYNFPLSWTGHYFDVLLMSNKTVYESGPLSLYFDLLFGPAVYLDTSTDISVYINLRLGFGARYHL